jgi:hypothetical protein
MTCRLVIFAVVLLLSGLHAPVKALQSGANSESDRIQTADRHSIEDARHGRYIAASYGYLAALGVDSAAKITDDDAYDQWSQVWSCMTGVHVLRPGKKPDYHVTPAEITLLKSAQGRAAIPEIVARAKKTRIVILDEGHLMPRDREFGLQVARALRPIGYTVLAVEALTRDEDDGVSLAKMNKLLADGYLRQSSGYYLDDPVFADFLRKSMALGYRLVSYEATKAFAIEDSEKAEAMREQEQAENIVRRGLNANPHAKVLIYCGIHHAAEGPLASEPQKNRVWMAAWLKKLTGIDPVTIDQATLAEAPSYKPDVDLYAIASAKAKSESVILMADNKPLTVGLLGGVVDLQVVHPVLSEKEGRPGWLPSKGRKPVRVPSSLLPKKGVRLVQAFIAAEAADAIPVDQVLVFSGQPVPELMLPNLPIRYAFQEYVGDSPGKTGR